VTWNGVKLLLVYSEAAAFQRGWGAGRTRNGICTFLLSRIAAGGDDINARQFNGAIR